MSHQQVGVGVGVGVVGTRTGTGTVLIPAPHLGGPLQGLCFATATHSTAAAPAAAAATTTASVSASVSAFQSVVDVNPQLTRVLLMDGSSVPLSALLSSGKAGKS